MSQLRYLSSRESADDDSGPPAVPWFLRIPAVVALSVVGAGLGLAVIWFYPHSGPDEAFLARLKWWEENAASLQKSHRLQEPRAPWK